MGFELFRLKLKDLELYEAVRSNNHHTILKTEDGVQVTIHKVKVNEEGIIFDY